VDGNRERPPATARMAAPALVAVDAPAGTDHVVFRFHGYGDYPELLALSGLTLAMVAVAPACVRRARRLCVRAASSLADSARLAPSNSR